MENKCEFYIDKRLAKNKLIKNILIFIASTVLFGIVLFFLKSTPLTTISICFVPVFMLYWVIRSWIQFNYSEPLIVVSSQYLTFKSMNFLFTFKVNEIKIDEIKTIGTDIKMKGEDTISESLSLKMLNEKKFSFPMDLFEITHVELYNKIKELNPNAKLLNIGDFAYE